MSEKNGKKSTKKKVGKTSSAKKKKAVKPDFYIQYGGKEIDAQDVLDRIKDIWTKEMENEADDLKELKVYVKPEEDAAYFVINGDIKGSFGLSC